MMRNLSFLSGFSRTFSMIDVRRRRLWDFVWRTRISNLAIGLVSCVSARTEWSPPDPILERPLRNPIWKFVFLTSLVCSMTWMTCDIWHGVVAWRHWWPRSIPVHPPSAEWTVKCSHERTQGEQWKLPHPSLEIQFTGFLYDGAVAFLGFHKKDQIFSGHYCSHKGTPGLGQTMFSISSYGQKLIFGQVLNDPLWFCQNFSADPNHNVSQQNWSITMIRTVFTMMNLMMLIVQQISQTKTLKLYL